MARVDAGVLDVSYDRYGTAGGPSVVLLHGFPYDVRAYDDVVAPLADGGADVVVPYLRGYGPTRFRDGATMRSGQQAALAHDLLALIDALGLTRPVVAGYDWGGRAACLVSMLWPERVAGLVTAGGWNVQNIARSGEPAPPAAELRYWYQYYLHGERGRRGLERHRAEFTRLLWTLWSPTWSFTEATFADTVSSFDNPDFVEVVVHSYRHRYGLVPGDPSYQDSEDEISRRTTIDVPTVVVDATADGVTGRSDPQAHAARFPQLVANPAVPVGHNVPQEAPAEFAAAVAALLG